ncbi:LamG domain-containing protein, partial [Chloroflexota bacterium]
MKKTRVLSIMLPIAILTAAFALAVPTNAGAQLANPAGMVSYWKFDEDIGTSALDSVGTNQGTVLNGGSWTTGRVGSALSFDGVNDYVEVVDSASLDVTEQISLEAWIMPKGQYRTENIVGKWGNTSRQTGTYTLNLRSGKPELELSRYGNDWVSVISPNALDPDQWYHLAGTSDGNWARLYVNGTLVHELTLPDYPYTIHTNDQPVAVGAIAEADTYIRWFFYGIIDEVAIWSKALTSEEIQLHYLNGLTGKGYCDSALSTLMDLITTVRNLNLPYGIEHSLISKLENALKSLDKGNDGAATNQLNAFINAVEAQSGKNVKTEDAKALIEQAQKIIIDISDEGP